MYRPLILSLLALAGLATAAPHPFTVPKAPPLPDRPAYRAARAEPDCTGAPTLVVTPDLVEVLTGDTTDGPSLVDGYGCVAWQETGPEAVWLLDVQEDTALHASVASTADLDVFLLSNCDSDSCVAWHASEFLVVLAARAEPYVLVIDGYLGDAGAFELSLTGYGVGPSADVCVDAEHVPCGEAAAARTGNLYGRPNRLLGDDCATYLEFGGEQWFSVTLSDSATVTATLSDQLFDAAIWLYEGCEPGSACAAFIDEGNAGVNEILDFRNLSGSRRTYYLAVDAFRAVESEGTGGFTLTLRCDGQIVSNERKSLGAMKAMFR